MAKLARTIKRDKQLSIFLSEIANKKYNSNAIYQIFIRTIAKAVNECYSIWPSNTKFHVWKNWDIQNRPKIYRLNYCPSMKKDYYKPSYLSKLGWHSIHRQDRIYERSCNLDWYNKWSIFWDSSRRGII